MLITYRVTGRYMNGTEVYGYHLVGEDGSQVVANKERIIYMIGRGQVENMRVQTSNGEMILRGKGINLNNLPVMNLAKHKRAENNDTQRLSIIKRIIKDNICIGYMVRDLSGKELKLSKSKVVELIKQGIITNAEIQKYSQSSNIQMVIKGIGFDINKLPVVMVDESGKLIDTTKNEDLKKIFMRAIRMKRGGIVHDIKSGAKSIFEPGDYLICGIAGRINVVKQDKAQSVLVISTESKVAICDNNFSELNNYPIELFGVAPQVLSFEKIKGWPIVKILSNR